MLCVFKRGKLKLLCVFFNIILLKIKCFLYNGEINNILMYDYYFCYFMIFISYWYFNRFINYNFENY